jgi:hypothetical protein
MAVNGWLHPENSCAADTVDRVVASIGSTTITQSDAEVEYRFEMFLEGHPQSPPPDSKELDQARDRLIQQTLLTLEAEGEGLKVENSRTEAMRWLDQVRKDYPDSQSYQSALAATTMTEEEALARLENHVRTLRLIDQRLRPNAWVDQKEIGHYYEDKFSPDYTRRTGVSAPALDKVEDEIREILVQQKVDQLLAEWLKEIRESRHVEFHSF